jgi:hypothetical protein
MMIGKFIDWVRGKFLDRVDELNLFFNRQSTTRKRAMVLLFGIGVTVISVALISKALKNQENSIDSKPDRVVMPYDIFMQEERIISKNQLTPVGKMKGEIDGEFESFYVAVDSEGAIYINRDIEYSANAYDKTDGWKQISKEKLMEYDRDLHFIPSQMKSMRK